MRTVGLKVLKNRLSEYVRAAARGETVLVTDRGDVVAKLVPPQREDDPNTPEARYSAAVKAGIITPALRRGGALPASISILPLADLMKELDEDRADR
jgi:prevent-host-death family protein